MANQRNKSKKMVGFYASPEEKRALEALAKKHKISLSELLRRLATGSLILFLSALALLHCVKAIKQTVSVVVAKIEAKTK